MISNRTDNESITDVTVTEESTPTQNEFQVVYILTYAPTNELKTTYVNSLATTIRYAMLNGIKVIPYILSGVENASMAKNELLNNLRGIEYHSAVFIAHDIAWDPVSFVQNLISKEDVVGLPVVKKRLGNVIFDLDLNIDYVEKNEEGLIKVNYASLGFLTLKKKVIDDLLDSSPSITNNTGNEVKNVFEYQIKDGQSLSDNIVICNKIKDYNYDIWLNPNSTCAQMADNLYAVDFMTTVFPQPQEQSQAEVGTETPLPASDDIKSLYE